MPYAVIFNNLDHLKASWGQNMYGWDGLLAQGSFNAALSEHGHETYYGKDHLGGFVKESYFLAPGIHGTDETRQLTPQEKDAGVTTEFAGKIDRLGRNITLTVVTYDPKKHSAYVQCDPRGSKYTYSDAQDISEILPENYNSDVDGDGNMDTFLGVVLDGNGHPASLIFCENEKS